MAGYKVQLHQISSEPSAGSSYSPSLALSSPSPSTRPSTSTGTRRVYTACEPPPLVPADQGRSLTPVVAGHASGVAISPNNAAVINHNRTGYQSNSPSPGYGGAYYTR
ncbi:hypothetical protein DCS_07342 [Drechmeria coniospora]|uniref:Uncharacterized protein n=1 Tax=Drechmeria coniospora TaxID=98403 RepID=A0A151GE57_DRECN|nr:hypothetical protein DCS_07342 [Drechmeria coniospora]KYK55379.1 hypothetical protein DCS_07342 [Drechmeria coniospora]